MQLNEGRASLIEEKEEVEGDGGEVGVGVGVGWQAAGLVAGKNTSRVG